jgi:Cu(I)/Ag(I) efflux system membrane fusion protein
MSAEQIERLAGTTVPHPTMTFLSPLAGTILEKNVREGQYVEEGMTLYQLADLRTVWVVLEVYERDLARVRIGQTARIAVEAYPGSVLTGRVTFVDPVLNPETRTVKVRVEAANTSGMLRPNMYVRGEIALASRQALLVPGTAIVSTGTRSVVWVEVRENVFEPRPVSIGRTGTGRSEILAGLAEGERVAESGGFLLDSESSLSAPAAPAQAHPGHAQGGVVEIHVKGGYTPEVVRVPAGQAVTLRFVRDEDAACSAEVLFPTLGIRRSLAPFAATDILLPPQSAGRVPFTCGMEMLEGTIVVEEP